MIPAGFPKSQGLYDPRLEKDSCGVGFIVDMKGRKSHQIVRSAIEILENLSHRGACGCDPKTGDGAGILMQTPDVFLRKRCKELGFDLPPEGQYAAGLVFLPTNVQEKNTIEGWFKEIVEEEGQKLLGWRDVPHDSSQIGRVARSVEPEFRQIFIGQGPNVPDRDFFDRKLYVIRKLIELKVRESKLTGANAFHVSSLAARTLVYKGQLMPDQLDRFYKDLADKDMSTAMALVHSRYSTNTFPTWSLAHPYRMLSHNGEINTLRGNINWMRAREQLFVSKLFGDDIKKVLPILTPDASDSAIF